MRKGIFLFRFLFAFLICFSLFFTSCSKSVKSHEDEITSGTNNEEYKALKLFGDGFIDDDGGDLTTGNVINSSTNVNFVNIPNENSIISKFRDFTITNFGTSTFSVGKFL